MGCAVVWGAAAEVSVDLEDVAEESNDPPSMSGMDPSQIEKIMIQELLDKPKGSKKTSFQFSKNRETRSGKIQKTDACRQKKNASIFKQRCRYHQKVHQKNEKINETGLVGD